MKIVAIGGIGHIGYALTGMRNNPTLQLCGFASATPGDMPDCIVEILTSEFKCKAFDDWREMLDVVKPDVAIATTRFDLNGLVSLECLKRGINCFTEKAIAHSFELLEQLEAAAKNNHCQIIGMHAMRYAPEFLAAYQAVKNDEIGNIVMLYGRKSYYFGDNRPDFYRQRKTYGGTILWVAIHALDWFYWFAGNVSQVYAAHTAKGGAAGECETAAVISIQFASGAVGTISADFLRSKNIVLPKEDQLRISGTRGVIEVRGNKAVLTCDDAAPRELELKDEGDIFGDYCAFLNGSGNCLLDMADTFEVTRIALNARQSADSRTAVNLT